MDGWVVRAVGQQNHEPFSSHFSVVHHVMETSNLVDNFWILVDDGLKLVQSDQSIVVTVESLIDKG
jgi:hypothetical protein